jgi:hypothetical protein
MTPFQKVLFHFLSTIAGAVVYIFFIAPYLVNAKSTFLVAAGVIGTFGLIILTVFKGYQFFTFTEDENEQS